MATRPAQQLFNREQFESVMRQRFFYAPSFEIYGGVSGLYDYGPSGCALQSNIIDLWKKHFILEEDMLEVDCTALTPAEVLKTSGHVDKFTDWMTRDLKTGEIFRADHLVEEVLEARIKGDAEARGVAQKPAEESDDKKKRKKKVKEITAVKLEDSVRQEYENVLAQIDNYDGEALGELIKKFDIRNPANGEELAPPVEFNLMFETQIGPSGNLKGYFRPETAQGQFLNFSKLLDANNNKMPFASASVGKSFRNEISPRAGLLRVREFLMAEIEHFVDPENKKHPRFSEVADLEIEALPSSTQLAGKTESTAITLGKAVSDKMIDNETLGYFIGRIALFMQKIGVDPKRMRFRQHLQNEMAHYAADCWDCELQSSYGWVECVGCADRSAYDLTVHQARTNTRLTVREALEKPRVFDRWEYSINRKKFGPVFRKDAGQVEKWLQSQTECELETLSEQLASTGEISVPMNEAKLTSELITIEKRTVKENIREYTPNVIEPSFGIGRVLYSLLEHSYWMRPEDSTRGVMSFKPAVAPTKVLVCPLSSNAVFEPLINELTRALRRSSIAVKVDDSSASIGRRYARNDEVGTPFGITVDFQSVEDHTVTIRERDSTIQKRGSIEDVIKAIQSMVDGASWDEGTKHLKIFEGQEASS